MNNIRKIKANDGFTLLELMVVLTIIGILAAYAIPTYQGYIVRGKIAEGLHLASAAKLAVVDNAQSYAGYMSLGYADCSAGEDCVNRIDSENVDMITVSNETGIIEIYYEEEATGGILVLHPFYKNSSGVLATLSTTAHLYGSIQWECLAAGTTSVVEGVASGTLDSRYAPANCR